MISEFQELSDKIDRLAQLTQSLRSENYLLRQANALLSAENVDFKNRLLQAQQRVEAMLAQLEPADADAAADAEDAEDASANPDDAEAAQ
jgi:cell division protein ZapB